jgi:hypothetical protein
MTDVESKALKSVGYDKKSRQLRVRHSGGGFAQYDDVPESVFMKLLTSDSVGSHYNDHIRKNFTLSEEL